MADPSVSDDIRENDGESRRWNDAIAAGRGSAAWSDLLDDLVTFALHQLRHEVRTGTIVRWCAQHFQRPMGPLPQDWGAPRPRRHRARRDHGSAGKDVQRYRRWKGLGSGARQHRWPAYFLDLCTGTFSQLHAGLAYADIDRRSTLDPTDVRAGRSGHDRTRTNRRSRGWNSR